MFTDNDKLIFKYHRGDKEVFGDPLAIQRRLVLACGGRFDEWWDAFYFVPRDGMTPEQVQAGALAAAGAGEGLLAAARSAFGMKEFDPETGDGATEARVDAALRAWSEWCASKKASGGS